MTGDCKDRLWSPASSQISRVLREVPVSHHRELRLQMEAVFNYNQQQQIQNL